MKIRRVNAINPGLNTPTSIAPNTKLLPQAVTQNINSRYVFQDTFESLNDPHPKLISNRKTGSLLQL